jgi:hypothetical protein
MLGGMLVTHLPPPSAVGDGRPWRAWVRQIWIALGDAGAAFGGLFPGDLDLGGDKTIHVILFAVPGAWWAAALVAWRRFDARGIGVATAGMAAWSVVSETSQSFACRRGGEWGDIAANVLGVLLAVGAVAVGRAIGRTARDAMRSRARSGPGSDR